MPTWWDSAEAVDRFNTMMQVAIAVFGVLTAAATVLSVKAANRVSELKDQESAALRARLEAAELAIKPRGLSEADEKELVALLAPFAGSTVDISAIAGDSEAAALATQLRRVFDAAGFKPGPVNGFMTPGVVEGLTILIRSEEEKPPYAASLQGALKNMGFDANGATRENIEPGGLAIVIGNKPRPSR